MYTGNALLLRLFIHLASYELCFNPRLQLAWRECIWANQTCSRCSHANYYRRHRRHCWVREETEAISPDSDCHIVSVLIYRPNLSAHRFRTPHIIAIGYLVFGALVATYLSTWMSRENRRRDLILHGQKEDGAPPLVLDEKTSQKLGDRDVRYRYVI